MGRHGRTGENRAAKHQRAVAIAIAIGETQEELTARAPGPGHGEQRERPLHSLLLVACLLQ